MNIDRPATTCPAFYNVLEFGVRGDGETKDTLALQQAIDCCAASGGGKVLLPPGRYLSGTLFLKSHVELHLSSGATLVGSPDRDDYNADDVFPENQAFASETVSAAHLIIAYGVENVAITGSGTIDGNSAAFFGPLPADAIASYSCKNADFPIPFWRPGQMVFMCRCRNVVVRDVSLRNSPYWTLFLLGCEDVHLRGLTITSPPATKNGDGIDVDCCQRVTISDCIIATGDDSITVRANSRPLGEYAKPCEDIVVNNCILSSPCNAIRVGVGDGHIRRCSFNSIIVKEACRAISIVSRYSNFQDRGAIIEQVHFSDFIVDALVLIAVATGSPAAPAQPPAAIRDISFSRFHIRASAGSQLVGSPSVPLQRLRLTDFDWHIHHGTENDSFVRELPAQLSHHGHVGAFGHAALPCVLLGRDLEEITLDNHRVRWDDISAAWLDGFVMENSTDVEFRGMVLRQPHDHCGAALRVRNCDGITVNGSRAETGTSTFLQIDEPVTGARMTCINNDFSAAAVAVSADGADATSESRGACSSLKLQSPL